MSRERPEKSFSAEEYCYRKKGIKREWQQIQDCERHGK